MITTLNEWRKFTEKSINFLGSKYDKIFIPEEEIQHITNFINAKLKDSKIIKTEGKKSLIISNNKKAIKINYVPGDNELGDNEKYRIIITPVDPNTFKTLNKEQELEVIYSDSDKEDSHSNFFHTIEKELNVNSKSEEFEKEYEGTGNTDGLDYSSVWHDLTSASRSDDGDNLTDQIQSYMDELASFDKPLIVAAKEIENDIISGLPKKYFRKMPKGGTIQQLCMFMATYAGADIN